MRKRFGNLEKPPLHVMGHCQTDHWPCSMDTAWEIFQETIHDFQEDFALRTHAFVMMGNHYHWLCTYNYEEDPELFDWFHEVLNMYFLKHIDSAYEPLYTFSDPPKVIQVESFPQYKETYKYVYNNPVNAGLVKSAFDYSYSTLPHAIGRKHLGFNVIDNMGVVYAPSLIHSWLTGEMDLWAQ
jgi:putative transposase